MRLPPLLAGALLAGFCSSELRAQNVLLLQTEDGRLSPVVEVHDITTYVLVNGRHILGRSGKFQLRPAPVYGDGTVRLHNFSMHSEGVILNESANALNNRLYLSGTFTASPGLQNAYFAFEGTDENGHPKSLGVVSLPRLPDNLPVAVNVSMPMVDIPDQRSYRLHVFSGLYECRLLEGRTLDFSGPKTVSSDQRDSGDRSPQPYFLIAPAYPAALKAEGPAGKVLLHCSIGADGTMLATTVLQADRPEFGLAAQEAVNQWLFQPAVQGHRYVPIEVNIPVNFHAQPKPAG